MQRYNRTKLACYITNISMSVVTNLGPILFLSFKELYGISYTEIGLLILLTFSVQLLVDLIFSFFPHIFNIPLTVRITPIITIIGLVLFALAPILFEGAVFLGLVLGVVIYSASAGLVEVLISPVIAAIPAENPEREMSKLHSIYAWGVVGVVPVATLFLFFFGTERWQLLALLFATIPLLGAILFAGAEIPQLSVGERDRDGGASVLRNPSLWLSFVAIFLGGALECTMAQWASAYLEAALGIEKVWGDLFGVTLFAAMLGLGRTLYSKRGRQPERVVLFGGVGALFCYLVSALSPIPVLGLIACAACGLCVSMLWPGNLIIGTGRVGGGVIFFALMAAGGDLGASVAPQIVGIIADAVSASGLPSLFPAISAEELGMRAGLFVGALFALAAIAVYAHLFKTRDRASTDASIDGEQTS